MELEDLENIFFIKCKEVENFYLDKYPEAEQKGFSEKVKEAEKFLISNDPSDCLILKKELEVFLGREPTLQEISDKVNEVLYKKNLLGEVSGKIAGLRKKFYQDPYSFDFNEFDILFPEVFI